MIGILLISETVFEVVNQENDKLDQKRKSKLANINGHGELSSLFTQGLFVIQSQFHMVPKFIW